MAKIEIRFHSEVDVVGEKPLRRLEAIANNLEGFCSYILGDPGKLEMYHKQMLLNTMQLLKILIQQDAYSFSGVPSDDKEYLDLIERTKAYLAIERLNKTLYQNR